MRFESRTWFLVSLVLFAAAIYFWKRGNEYQTRKSRTLPALREKAVTNSPTASAPSASGPIKLLTQLAANPAAPGSLAGVQKTSAQPTRTSPTPPEHVIPYRLSNTTKTLRQLTRSDTAILMRNALIDTAEKTELNIPDYLKAQGASGSYIVQARGPIQAGFRNRLRELGGSVVAYIPNNAYLVTLSAAAAQELGAQPETQAVLPYEPYFKLDGQLLALAVKQEPLLADEWLRVTAFPGAREPPPRT